MKKYIFRAWRHYSITFHTSVSRNDAVSWYTMTDIAYWSVFNVVYHGVGVSFYRQHIFCRQTHQQYNVFDLSAHAVEQCLLDQQVMTVVFWRLFSVFLVVFSVGLIRISQTFTHRLDIAYCSSITFIRRF